MPNKFPSRLKKCPIINSVCEIRYTSNAPIDSILPGILHASLPGNKIIHPVLPVPQEIVRQDPSMQSVPSFNLEWEHFIIIGNFTYVSVSYIPPYKRWSDFKQGICKIFKVLFESEVFLSITRYSIKYIDLIEIVDDIMPLDLLNVEIRVMGEQLSNENTVLRVERQADEILHVINVATSARVQLPDGTIRHGVLIDTDSLCLLDTPLPPMTFLATHEELLDKLHKENKDLFFSLLTEKTINMLEPEYDNN
jgi:uncharacterized protein (TIGR04255 family)